MKCEFEILSGKTAWLLGTKVSKRLQQGWELYGATWSSGEIPYTEFHQSVKRVTQGDKK